MRVLVKDKDIYLYMLTDENELKSNFNIGEFRNEISKSQVCLKKAKDIKSFIEFYKWES